MVGFVVVANAQEQPTPIIDSTGTRTLFLDNMADMIEPLNKAEISTGLLADKAFILSSMNEFNGETDGVISLSRWKQIYRQLYNASVTETVILSPDSLKTRVQNYLLQNIIPIGILNAKYNAFKPYILDSNLLLLSEGKLYDMEDRNQSPYNENNLFAAAPLQGRIYRGHVTFRIDDDFIISNTSDTIVAIEVDFGDGSGFQTVTKGSNVTINYFEVGIKNMIVKITFSNNTVLQSHSSFKLMSVSSVAPDYTFSVSGYLPYNGLIGTGEVSVLYGCGNNNQLRKPIIVSDGFDPGNTRHFDELYDMLNKENFIEKLRAEGFDFVILDYDDGAGYIQQNAYVLISLINTINAQLANNGSNSQLVIIGPSMGGLISRYALSYMEQNNLDHNTRLFVSFDAPHLGANIPLGDQFWLMFFSMWSGAQATIDGLAKINTPAAKQLLVYHYTTSYSGSANPHTLRTALINDPYFQFPTQCRKIAIANGSGNGTNFFNPCSQIINYVYHVSVLGNIIKGNAWAVPSSGGQCTIFEGKFPTQFLLGNTANPIPIGYTSTAYSISGSLPYDGAPGGSGEVNKTIAGGDTQGHGTITTNHPKECFIPSISALAINTNNLNYNIFGITDYPYPTSNISPFDAIYASTINEDHVLVTTDNSAFAIGEISSDNLYLQNKTIANSVNFEARNIITIGNNVDPVPNRQATGNFVTENNSVVNIHAGDEIIVKDETWFKAGSNTHLYIERFACSSALRMANINETENNTNQINEVVYNTETQTNQNINNISEENFAVMPNPNEGEFKIVLPNTSAKQVLVSVSSLLGVAVFENTYSNVSEVNINIKGVAKGMYLVKVNAEGKTFIKKVVVN